MGKYRKLRDYIVRPYETYPAEIQKKVEYLMIIDFFGLAVWIMSVIMNTVYLIIYSELPSLFIMIGDLLWLIIFPLSLYAIKKEHPISAGNLTMGMLFLIILNLLVADYMSMMYIHVEHLYKTIILVFIGILIVGLCSLKRRQIIIYTVSGFSIIIIHFCIIYPKTYSFLMGAPAFMVLFESITFFIIGSLAAFILNKLTTRNRIDLFSNIILYKFDPRGPTTLFYEKEVDTDLLTKTGIYFYTAVGQGISYNTGLFGPLPFDMKNNLEALVYSALIKDSESPDHRLVGENFILIAFLAKTGTVHLIDRKQLTDHLSKHVKIIEDLSKLTEQDFKRLVFLIRSQ